MRALTLAAFLFLGAAPAVAQSLPAASQLAGTVRMLVPNRTIARGEIISASDLGYVTMPASRAVDGLAHIPADLTGKQSRRVLSAGEPVRVSDVRSPILVTKGQIVTMTFSAPGITLTAEGRAMSEGGLGESVTVLNPVSYRQVTAVVSGAGAVTAGALPSAAPSPELTASTNRPVNRIAEIP